MRQVNQTSTNEKPGDTAKEYRSTIATKTSVRRHWAEEKWEREGASKFGVHKS